MSGSGLPRVAFFGSSEFAIPSLEALAGVSEIIAVYTRPPRPAGRSKKLRGTPVSLRAAELGCTVCTPECLSGDEVFAELFALAPDLGIVVAYGSLLPESLLAVPGLGFFNVHASLLPRWRGAAPIQRAMLAGDSVSGVTIMRVVQALDSGPVLARKETSIRENETAGKLGERLAIFGAELLVDSLPKIMVSKGQLEAQKPEMATYAEKIQPVDRRINWNEPAEAVLRRILALAPRPGAWCELEKERVRILDARGSPGCGKPGELLDERFRVACGTGAVRVLTAQRPGRRALPAADLLRGMRLSVGGRLG